MIAIVFPAPSAGQYGGLRARKRRCPPSDRGGAKGKSGKRSACIESRLQEIRQPVG